eukprot:SM000040S14858  [mRNA]  locus=s40:745132:749308:- [translate_table: standard]
MSLLELRKVLDQAVRDIQREVNKNILNVSEIEQKVLDATNDEAWGPHGTAMLEIAQASRRYSDFQKIMAIIWKRLAEREKNWRHMYKALTLLEFLVAHGSEKVIDEFRESTYQIKGLVNFQFVEPNGKDQGINVRKKAQTILALLQDTEKIREVRAKASANKDKYGGISSTGHRGRGASYQSGGSGYDDDDFEDAAKGYGSSDRDPYGASKDSGYGAGWDDANSKVNQGSSRTNKWAEDDNDGYEQADHDKTRAYEDDEDEFDPRTINDDSEKTTRGIAAVLADNPSSGPYAATDNDFLDDDDFGDFDPRGDGSGAGLNAPTSVAKVAAPLKPAAPPLAGTSPAKPAHIASVGVDDLLGLDFLTGPPPASTSAAQLDPLASAAVDPFLSLTSDPLPAASALSGSAAIIAPSSGSMGRPAAVLAQPSSGLGAASSGWASAAAVSLGPTSDSFGVDDDFTTFMSASGMPPASSGAPLVQSGQASLLDFEPSASSQSADVLLGMSSSSTVTSAAAALPFKGPPAVASALKQAKPKLSLWDDTLTSGLVDLSVKGYKDSSLNSIGIGLTDPTLLVPQREEERSAKPAPLGRGMSLRGTQSTHTVPSSSLGTSAGLGSTARAGDGSSLDRLPRSFGMANMGGLGFSSAALPGNDASGWASFQGGPLPSIGAQPAQHQKP